MKKVFLVAGLLLCFLTSLYPMSITIRTLTGENMPMDVEPTDLVIFIKQTIQNQEGISIACQRLVFAGKTIEDNRTLADYNIQKEATIHLLVSTPSFTDTIPDIRITTDSSFTLEIPDTLFTLAPDTLVVLKNDSTPLPSWINFDYSTKTLTGIPTGSDSVEVVLYAKQYCGEEAFSTDTFKIIANSPTKIESTTAQALKIVPNPVKEKLVLDVFFRTFDRYSIVDAKGTVLKTGEMTESVIDVSNLPKGSYVIRFVNQKETVNKKFIKE